MHAFDRRTDRQTEFPSLYRDCIPCSAVMTTDIVRSEKNVKFCHILQSSITFGNLSTLL